MKSSAKKKGNNRTLPLIIIGIGVLLVIGVVFISALNAPTTSAPQSSSLDIPFPNVTRVDVKESKQAYDNGTALFLDIRDAGSYASGHIDGAVNIPLEELEARTGELPADKWIITYCT